MEVQAEKSFMDITDYVILGSGSDNESIHSGMAATDRNKAEFGQEYSLQTRSQDCGLLLPEGWNRCGFLKQEYRHDCAASSHTCSLIGVSMGRVLVVHGVTGGNGSVKTDSLQLRLDDYVQSPVLLQDVCRAYRHLDRLSLHVKDFLCQPMLSKLYNGSISSSLHPIIASGSLHFWVGSMSFIVWFKVCSYLSARSLAALSQVCREYSAVCRDPFLWRRLYLSDFGRFVDTSIDKDWYTMYKEHLQRQSRRHLQRRHMFTCIPQWFSPGPSHIFNTARPHFHDGIIGGDYDLMPEVAVGIPHPLFARLQGPTIMPANLELSRHMLGMNNSLHREMDGTDSISGAFFERVLSPGGGSRPPTHSRQISFPGHFGGGGFV